MKDVSVIVLAAWAGERFGQPKQFLELKPGVRLVDAAVNAALNVTNNVILVLPDGYKWNGRPVSSVVTGGESRSGSVAAGLSLLTEHQEVVVIHDAAHPLAPRQIFLDVIRAVRSGVDAAVPFLSASDVVKQKTSDGHLITVGRDGLGLAQVPMAFSGAALVNAYSHSKNNNPQMWEDSMLLEHHGGQVAAVEGLSMNVHIVNEQDLALARAIAASDSRGELNRYQTTRPNTGLEE